MSLANDAKIVLIPSGYKTATPYGKLYSVLPTDGDQDFRIDRATTASRINPGGLIEQTSADTPRVDHTGGGCPSLLLEPNRTNLIYFSEQFSGTNWSPVNITITANNTIAPDGEMTGVKLQRTSTSANYVSHNISKSASSLQYATSVFVKEGSENYFALRAQGSYPSRVDIRFRFDTEQIYYAQAVSNFTLIDYNVDNLTNGWYRLNFSYTTDTHTNLGVSFSARSTDGNIDSSDTSSNAFSYVWGAQTEQGIGQTSYIKTTSGIGSRDFDNLECTNTYTLGTDATFYFDFEAYSYDSSFKQAFMVRNGAFSEYIDLISYVDSNIYYMRIRASANGGTENYLIAFGERDILFFQRNKVALRLYENNFEIYLNGSQIKTGTSSAGNFDVLNGTAILNDFGASNERPSCKLYDFRIYDKTITQSELETLTTL